MKRESEQEIEQLEEEVKQEVKEEDKGSDAEDNNDLKPGYKKYPPKCRIAIIAGYNGTNFSGSQK